MNDFVVSCATSIESMRCSSLTVPSVTDTSACVCPRVNSAEPCVRAAPHLGADRADGVEIAAIHALAVREHLLAHSAVFDVLDHRGDVLRVLGELGRQLFLDGRLEGASAWARSDFSGRLSASETALRRAS